PPRRGESTGQPASAFCWTTPRRGGTLGPCASSVPATRPRTRWPVPSWCCCCWTRRASSGPRSPCSGRPWRCWCCRRCCPRRDEPSLPPPVERDGDLPAEAHGANGVEGSAGPPGHFLIRQPAQQGQLLPGPPWPVVALGQEPGQVVLDGVPPALLDLLGGDGP